jgi:hypothetical protein
MGSVFQGAFQGASIGGQVGGPWGAVIGAVVGAAAGAIYAHNNTANAPQAAMAGPPRLNELGITGATLGNPIPLLYGRNRISGQYLWMAGIEQRVTVVEHEVQTTKDDTDIVYEYFYHYYLSCAFALCHGKAVGLRRIWMSDQIIYENGVYLNRPDIQGHDINNETPTEKNADKDWATNIRFYRGTEDQLPDVMLETTFGVGKTPAFRGLAYVVFDRLYLTTTQTGYSAISLPEFKFEIDGQKCMVHAYTTTRPSPAFSLSYYRKRSDEFVYDSLRSSAFSSYTARDILIGARTPFLKDVESAPIVFTKGAPTTEEIPAAEIIDAVPLFPAFADDPLDETRWSYQQIIDDMKDIAATYPSAEYDVVGYSVLGREIGALRLFDDGRRPIICISQGIHGDERDAAAACSKLLRSALSGGSTPVYNDLRDLLSGQASLIYNALRESFSIYLLGTVNPDGMTAPVISEYGGTGTRNNANDVNLNRNWPYYWYVSGDTDKGAYPASEPETYHIINYLSKVDTVVVDGMLSRVSRVSRIICHLDLHGWNSRTSWGLLTEQIYHDKDTQRNQRAANLFGDHFLREYDWSNHTLINGVPALTEFRSARKPYIYTWIKNRSRWDSFCGLLEYPQHENVGVIASACYAILLGLCAAAVDAEQENLGGAVITPALDPPLNQNSLLTAWDAANRRPNYFSVNGLRLTQLNPAGRIYVRSYRPEQVGWPIQFSGAGYAIANGWFYVIGGENDAYSLPSCNGESLETGVKSWDQGIPVSATHGAATSDGMNLYFAGGYNNATASYLDGVYRAAAPPLVWDRVATLPAGVQRCSMAFSGGKLYLSGGRTASGYQTAIWRIDPATGVTDLFGNMLTARGWHTSAVYDGNLYVFGGWGGAETLASCEKINLTTGVATAITPIPFSRAQQGIGTDGNMAYLCCGRSGTTIFPTVYAYDMASETVSELTYAMVSITDGDDGDEPTTSKPYRLSPACFVHPDDGTLAIVGGEKSDGLTSDSYYFIDIDNGDGYLRQTDDAHWGYIRPTQAFYGTPGEHYAAQVAVRNADEPNDEKNPYVRLTVIIGPIATPQRKLRLGYTVPPQDGFHTYTLPFTLQPDETEFRIYLRHYGGGTRVDIGALQVLSGVTAGVIVPEEGKAADTMEVEFSTGLSISGAFSPIWGSQQPIEQTVMTLTSDFNGDGVVDLSDFTNAPLAVGVLFDNYTKPTPTEISLKWVSTEDYSNPEYSTQFPDIAYYEPTGKFVLNYRISGVDYSEDLTGVLPLNHARTNREWRRDVVQWGIKKNVFYIWYYGRVFYKNFEAFSVARLLLSIASGVVMRNSRNLSAIVADLCNRAGLSSSQIDTGGITGEVMGYAIANQSSVRSYLEPLRTAYGFDLVERNGKLYFIDKRRDFVKTILYEDLVSEGGSNPISVSRAEERNMPQKVITIYPDQDSRYQQASQQAQRFTVASRQSMSMAIPIVMTADKARQIAEIVMYEQWMGRTSFEFSTSYTYEMLEPGDLVYVQSKDRTWPVRLLNKSSGQNGVIRWTAIATDPEVLTSDAVGGAGLPLTEKYAIYQTTATHLLDIPMLIDSDNNAGYYVAMGPTFEDLGTWVGANLYRSTNNIDYTSILSVALAAGIGFTQTALADGPTHLWDEAATVDIIMRNYDLESITADRVLNGENGILLGSEVLQYREAEMLAVDTYRLSGLLRGRRGTEWATGTHVAGERAILLAPGLLQRHVPDIDQIGLERYYKGVSVYHDPNDVLGFVFTPTAAGLKPYSPCHAKGTRDSSGNLALAWVRRTRVGGGWNDNTDVPLSEATETYEVDIYNGLNIVRTITGLSTAACSYTAAQQIADFGAAQSAVTLRIYQLSATVGRGYPLEVTL